MIIHLNQFNKSRNLLLEEELSPEDLDLDIGVMQYPQPLQVKVEAWLSEKDLSVDVHVEGVRHFTCSLCLEEFNNVFEKDLSLHYDIKGLDSVSLDPDIREELILDHPIRVLCRPNCQGLCPFCGANLNREKCDCKGQD